MRKAVHFVGSSGDDLRKFPEGVQEDIGYQIEQVQEGRMPDNFKPMNDVGSGAYEIRERDGATHYRVIYVAKLGNTVYILHAFRKNQNKTPPKDLKLAQKRYRDAAELAKQAS